MPEKKEPMIGQENRPTAIDFDMPISDFKLRDLYSIIHAQLQPELLKSEKELLKSEKEQFKEHLKPEKEKEHFKLEKEIFKEHLKPEKEKEYFKPEKEALKPEKELSKPEKPLDDPRVIDRVVSQVLERLKGQGVGR